MSSSNTSSTEKKAYRVCTCEKEFTKESPTTYVVLTETSEPGIWKKDYAELPESLDGFPGLEQLQEHIYHIFGCRGCCFTKDQVENNFAQALQASIVSCVYQRLEKDGEIVYEYLSDSLDPVFEEYCFKQGVVIGEPAVIEEGGEGVRVVGENKLKNPEASEQSEQSEREQSEQSERTEKETE